MHLYGYINLIESALGLIFSLTILTWSRLIGIEMQVCFFLNPFWLSVMLFFYVCIVEFPRVLCAMFLLPSIVPCHSLTLLDTNQTKPRDSALSSAITRKKPLIVGSVCLCMQSPVECQYYSDHHNPRFLFLCSFLWLVFVSFQ